jgi:hypothetical protein
MQLLTDASKQRRFELFLGAQWPSAIHPFLPKLFHGGLLIRGSCSLIH